MRTAPLLIFVFIVVLWSCKNQPKTVEKEGVPEQTIPEKIAHAHGFKNWKSVQEFTFTFNVDRDTTHFERTWVWKPKTNEITAISENDTLTYNRKSMDSIATKVNAGFINDRYWILAPFNLVWDANNYTFEHTVGVSSPISQKPMQKLTIVYGNQGGYTPGDAYDFYFGDDFIIREWVFRKANQPEPSTVTTWEDYVEMGGLQLAQDHKKAEGSFSLNFTNLKVN
ncbi:hypothetical protein [Flagellimonas sp. 2504JD1-5]